MTRTNIDIDDALVHAVMRQQGLRTKKEAVEYALRMAVRTTASVEEILELGGIGFGLTNAEVEELGEPRTW